jgi:DNA repair exonuclease SbcCD ATPase subunit
MQMQDFCEQMEKQIETYRASLSQIEAKLDAGGTQVKQQILPVVGDIKNLLAELNAQKDRLEKECPTEWSDEKSRMEDLVGQIGSHIDRTWGDISQGDIGG